MLCCYSIICLPCICQSATANKNFESWNIHLKKFFIAYQTMNGNVEVLLGRKILKMCK